MRNSPREQKGMVGGVVTYAVAIFMLVALLVYLVAAFFHAETLSVNPSTETLPSGQEP